MDSASTIHINLDSVARNLALIRSSIHPTCRICAVVKADAYGLGAARIGAALARAGADMLAVYRDREAVALSDLGVPILVLAPMRSIERAGEVHRMLLSGRLHCAVHGSEHLDELERAAAESGTCVPVHVEVDTGMGRGGRGLLQSAEVIQRVANSRLVRLAGIFTHYARADRDEAATSAQTAAFTELLHSVRECHGIEIMKHAANTHAMLRGPSTHFSMVRVGLAWTGFGRDGLDPRLALGVDPFAGVVSWRAGLVDVRHIRVGDRVGYGGKWLALRDSLVGTVPVGYADGYPCAAATREPPQRFVRVRRKGGAWHEAPVLGAVNMDQVSIDLTDVPWAQADVSVTMAAEVEVVGSDSSAKNYLPTVARSSHMHAYELLCRMHPRVQRAYDQFDAKAALGRSAERAIAVGA
ncbi:MAG: alanine racemase [Phycisphaerales bacterium]|nr:alanine racemase [Phycisphaerales bacterium]